tara:strand:- start:366 stop:4673 length:4308 start_codon:yes stop_codon:yes gene_type:complete
MKRFNTYNPYARLPKAQDGMNVRGNRNQLAQKETTTKNVGTWFEDAGKWVLNTLLSPIEGITQTNFYDPDMAHSGWQQFDDVFEGTHKGVGDALGYVYGGPMHAAVKAGGKGMMDSMGVEEDVAPMNVQYGGKIPKAQDSQTLPGTNQMNVGFPNGAAGAAQMGQMQQGVTGVMNGTQHFCPGGNCPPPTAGGQPPVGQTPQTLPQQPSNIPTNAGTYGDPTKGQGWSDAVMDAASDPAGAIGNMVGGFANAGKNPVVAKDTGVYQEITNNTDSHPGSLAQSMGDIIAGVDPTEYAYTKKHEDNAMRMKNASKQMRAVGNIGSGGIPSQYGGRAYQMGGTVVNPYMKSQMAQENARAQGGMENMAGKVGAAIQHAGGVVGESLSGMGMGGGGGGGMGGMMGGDGGGMGGMMSGGEGGAGGGMGGMMDVFGGGEGGSGGGFMDAIGGMFGGESGDNFNFGNIMSGIGGMMGQNGGRVPVRKGKSPYIATHYYQNGDEVRPEDMPRKATAADIKRIFDIPMVETPYPPTDSTDNPYYNIMNEIDVLTDPHQRSYEDFLNQPFQYGGRMPKAQDSIEIRGKRVDRDGTEYNRLFKKKREELEKKLTKPYTEGDIEYIKRWEQQYERQHEPFNEYMKFEIPSFKEELPVDSMPMYVQNGGRIPKAQMGGGMMEMLMPGMGMIKKLMGGLGGGGGQGGGQGGGGMDMSGMMEKMQNIDPEQWKAMQGMFKDGFSAEGLGNAIGGSAGEGIGGIVGGFMGGGGATKQNGGRLAKTSNLPMDMEGFTDLEQGFNRSNTIEINSGNNHSDLDNPHTPLNIPVPSFDEQGNAITENVQILAEKGEFARKDPDTEAVTIFSKNLIANPKTTGSSGKRTNYAKIAEKLGKKEDRLMEQAKNPFDDIADASIQRALSNVKNKFIRLEEEQKVAKELKEEEDRMDLMQLAKNGGRITKKNTYRVPGRKTSKVLSEYQKDLLGMDDQGQMPMAQYGMDSFRREELWDLTPAERKAKRAELKLKDKKEREERKRKNKEWKEGGKEASRKELEEDAKAIQKEDEKIDARAAKLDAGEALKEYSDIGDGVNREYADKEDPGQYDLTPSELAKQIKELPGGGSEKVLDPYTNEGARKAKELIENEYGPLDTKGGLPCPPCEDGSIPSRDASGNCLDCYSLAPEEEYSTAPEEEPGEQQQQRRGGGSGDSAINDYINNLRGINAEVEQGLTPYENYFEDYGRETEHIQRNAINDLPEWYMDRASQLASANVNSLENQIRNMGQSMGTSGYLAQMQAAKNKELAANQGYAAQAHGQREQQLGKIADTISKHRQVEAEGATVADDRTREAQDALYSAKYDTEKNILTGRLAQTREENAARRNELLDSQMQWMYNNDRTQYDKDGNPVNPGPATPQYGGKIKRDMYEYGSRVKREKQMKSDRAMNDFRSFMSDYNKK